MMPDKPFMEDGNDSNRSGRPSQFRRRRPYFFTIALKVQLRQRFFSICHHPVPAGKIPTNKTVNRSGYPSGGSTVKLVGSVFGHSAPVLMVRRPVTFVVRRQNHGASASRIHREKGSRHER
jgi:hypothetical protein